MAKAAQLAGLYGLTPANFFAFFLFSFLDNLLWVYWIPDWSGCGIHYAAVSCALFAELGRNGGEMNVLKI